MKAPRPRRPRPPASARPSTLTRRTKHTTVSSLRLPPTPRVAKPARRASPAKPPASLRHPTRRSRDIGRIVDEDEATVLDLLDNLLNKGVMLNADLILALANVDLVYIRLSALLCAADRVLPPRR